MEYLHSIRPYPVIHGDLKIQNVLVGDGLVAKVCDHFLNIFYLINSQLHKIHKCQKNDSPVKYNCKILRQKTALTDTLYTVSTFYFF